ncbi:MAG: hypothetical protein WBN11_15720 [Eudoraea sp.]|uniref:hypothetical protein n=1 Tax=Eudoraea sp. TaxID=1979955 RepID=UPI003C723FF4
MKNNKLLRILLGIGIIFLFLGVFSHFFVNKTVEKYLNSELEVLNSRNEYLYHIGDFDINILGGSVIFNDFQIKPSASYFQLFDEGLSSEPALKELKIDKISIKGIGISNLLFNKNLHIREIKVSKPTFKILKHPLNYISDSLPKSDKSSFYLDSIQIRTAKKITLSEFEITDYELQVLDIANNDTILRYSGKDMIIDGIELDPSKNNPDYFYFNTEKLLFKLEKQKIDLNGGFYSVGLEDLVYDHKTQNILIHDFSYTPKVDYAQIMSASKYSTEVYNLQMATMDVNGFDLNPLIHSGILVIDNISIDGLNAEIAKDKSKPNDTKKLKLLPQDALQKLKFPILIASINIQNSSLNYSEQEKAPKDLLDLHLTEINSYITNVTSLKDTTLRNKSLDIAFKTHISGEFPIETELHMPYNLASNNFTFSGKSTKAVTFDEFNSLIFKAINIKINGGTLNGLSWKAKGTSEKMEGDFTMFYKDLEVELYREDKSANKTLSWFANTVVPKSNPGNNGKLFVATMEFERVKYKGLGNYLWKSLLSGIVNSLNPLGKSSEKSSQNSKKTRKKKAKSKN